MFRNKSVVGKCLMLVLGLLAGGLAVAAVEDDIRARLNIGPTVCEFGQECAAGIPMPMTGSGEPKEPEEVYNTYCTACHGTGANNAPVMGNAEAWAPRIAKGIDVLYQSAQNGFNNGAMPPKGLCMDCSAEDLNKTVDFIVQASQ